MKTCIHLLAFQPDPPYRYRCVKCFQKLKIVNGVVLSQQKEKDWFNSHNGWGWEEMDAKERSAK